MEAGAEGGGARPAQRSAVCVNVTVSMKEGMFVAVLRDATEPPYCIDNCSDVALQYRCKPASGRLGAWREAPVGCQPVWEGTWPLELEVRLAGSDDEGRVFAMDSALDTPLGEWRLEVSQRRCGPKPCLSRLGLCSAHT